MTTTPLNLRTALLAAAAAGGLSSAAAAQTAPVAQLGEIVVTAQKKSENLQHAALSITAVTPAQISDQGIKNPFDLQTLLPNVRWQSSAVTVPIIRGVGTFNTSAGVDSSVAYSLDGVYLSHYPALPPVLFDIQRIEAVRGPQGTLYGRNSNAGVLNIISKDPGPEPGASASIQVGNYGTIASEAMLNLPINDKVGLRLSGGTNRHTPYSDDGFNDEDSWAGRGKLSIAPSDNLKILISVDGSRRNSRGTFFSICPPHSAQAACAGVPFRPFAGSGTDQPEDFNITKTFGVSGQINYSTPWAVLTSITGYRTYSLRTRTDSPHHNFAYAQSEDDEFITQEIRLSSLPSSRIGWVLGGYYSHEDQPDETDYSFSSPATFNVSNAKALGFALPHGEYTSKAVFADVTIPVMDRLRLKGGLRYTDETKTALGQTLFFFNDQVVGAVPTGGATREKRVTRKAGADFDVTPSNMLYVTASNGFKSGGVNQVPVITGLPTTYGPETIVAEEVGSKNRFLDGRLQINADAFHYDYSGFQVFTTLVDPTGVVPGFFFAAINSQKATFWGAELEASALLTPDDRLDLTATWLHTRFDRFVVPAAGLDYSGNSAANAPKYTFGGAFQHTFHLPDGESVRFRIDSQVVAGGYVDYSNNPGSYQDTYTRTGANLTYEARRGFSFTLYVRNIENSGILSTWQTPLDLPVDFVAVYPPRTFGFIVKKTF